MDKQALRGKIIFYLQKISRTDSLMSAVIHTGIQNNLNFGNLMQLIKDEYVNDPEGMTHCIGIVPLKLILKYHDN